MKLVFKVDLTDLIRFKKTVDEDLRRSGTGPIRAALKQWAFRYRSFLRRRYLIFSRGSGNWRPLRPGTIRRKRKRSTGILIDTGSMVLAFEPRFANKPGQLQQDIPFGIRVGFTGPGGHPEANLPMKELIRIHHFGLGVVPERLLVVPPDKETLDGMRGDMERAVKKMI